MQPEEASLFRLLKKEIVATMQRSYPGISKDISEWKGQEITDFQEELSRKVHEHISEKWFYTHMKGESDSLPRIDTLNLLSKYAGYTSWDDFSVRHEPLLEKQKPGQKANWYFIVVPILTIVVLTILFSFFRSTIPVNTGFAFMMRTPGKRSPTVSLRSACYFRMNHRLIVCVISRDVC